MSATNQFIEKLLTAVPELNEIYEGHLDDNGALLPHVFMGDVTRFVVDVARRDSDRALLRRLLSVVEEGLQSTEGEVPELLGVSFIENLCGEGDAITALLPLLSDAARRELKSICGE